MTGTVTGTTMRLELMRSAAAMVVVLALGMALAPGAEGQIVAGVDDGELTSEVTGRVVDSETGEPVWGAFVHLVDREDGTFTDSLGVFRLPVPARPNYTVLAEQLGYAGSMAGVEADESASPLEIHIEPDPVALQAIEVVAERFNYRRNSYGGGSVSHLDREQLLRRHSGQSAYDVAVHRAMLRGCGAATLEDWCAWDSGQLVSPRVIIDGRPMPWSGIEWLDDYAAEELYLLEIYDRGRFIQILTRWAVEERPEQVAALQLLPLRDIPEGFGSPVIRDVGINRAPTGLGNP